MRFSDGVARFCKDAVRRLQECFGYLDLLRPGFDAEDLAHVVHGSVAEARQVAQGRALAFGFDAPAQTDQLAFQVIEDRCGHAASPAPGP